MPANTNVLKKTLLVVSIFLIVAGLVLTIGGVFSPAWQVVEIREFRVEHQHGLWWDCTRAERHVVGVEAFYDEAPLHCMYKFDESAGLVIDEALRGVDSDGAAGESEHHRFWGWHKVTLFLILSGQMLAFVSVCTGACAPCFRQSTIIFAITLFIAMLFSVLADGIAFFSMNRVDTRFVQGMVGTYEQRIGYAFYLHIAGTLCWMLAFCACAVTTYEFLRNKDINKRTAYEEQQADHKQYSTPLLRPHYNQYQQQQPSAVQYIQAQHHHQQQPSPQYPKPRKPLLINGSGQQSLGSTSIVSSRPRIYRETMA